MGGGNYAKLVVEKSAMGTGVLGGSGVGGGLTCGLWAVFAGGRGIILSCGPARTAEGFVWPEARRVVVGRLLWGSFGSAQDDGTKQSTAKTTATAAAKEEVDSQGNYRKKGKGNNNSKGQYRRLSTPHHKDKSVMLRSR